MADPTQEQPMPWWVKPALGAYAMTIFASLAAASCFIGNDTLRTTMFTAAVALLGAAYQYFFGSSSGSDKKDATIAGTAAALATSVPVSPAEPSDAEKALAARISPAS